jgi:hypothetical protein
MITITEVRALEFAVDKVDVGGSVVELGATSLAALETVTVASITADVNIADGGNSITVDGTVELGATTLAALETIELGATTLAALENVVVSATDLDIRNLAFATDTVDVSNSVVALDSATLAALETVTVVEGSYNNWKATAHAASSTVSQVAATPLTGRINITIQNLGSKTVYIGATNAVTVSTGLKIAAGSMISEKLGASATIWAICDTGETASLRVGEFAP